MNIFFTLALLPLLLPFASAGTAPSLPPGGFVRVTAVVYGVCSPTGVFNVETRMRRLPHVKSFHFNLRSGEATVDFEPGFAVTEQQVRSELAVSGWSPKSIRVDLIPSSAPVAQAQ